MAIETVEVLIEGGKATAAPPLGPALGPLGVNIGQIVSDINKKTQDFRGMQVPVKVDVNSETKEYSISIGTPPASQLIIKEANIKKGSSSPNTDMVADLKIEQVIKVAKMKEDALLGKDPVERVKEILGTCQSMGVMVEGKKAHDTIVNIDRFKDKIMSGKTELSAAELKALEEEKKKLQEEIAAKHDEYVEKATEIMNSMQGKERHEIVEAMTEAEIPKQIIEEVVPHEEKKPEEGAAAKPAEEKEE